MASALAADTLLKALRDEGCKVVEYKSWRTHRRPASTGGFGPINGAMIHHTVTSGTSGSVALCYNGHSSLPGPLCHGVIDKDGTVWLVSNGRANHAGSGDDDVLRQVQDESYDRDRLLVPNEANTDGNSRFYGFECINLGNGQDPWPEVQRDAIVRASAAILRAYGGPAKGWTAKSVIGHKEWQPGKIDPRTGSGGVDVSPPVLRRLIDERLAHPASWTPGGASTPAQSEEDDMPTAREIAGEVAHMLLRTDGQYKAPKDAADYNPDPKSSRHWWSGQTAWDVLLNSVRATETKVAAMEKQIAGLSAAVQSLAGQLGDDVDTATVVAAVQQAIADAVVQVDIDVTGTPAE